MRDREWILSLADLLLSGKQVLTVETDVQVARNIRHAVAAAIYEGPLTPEDADSEVQMVGPALTVRVGMGDLTEREGLLLTLTPDAIINARGRLFDRIDLSPNLSERQYEITRAATASLYRPK